ncbi:hypothetical protein P4O66_020825 [Electrophorus voltai]|uniref:Uncharacterized protein n=1 Tax=Electrophorus voltai TaxID=2609070 RepID=A0AAD8ZR50_9TELE|nr:hypothetical protein P4O66_020825 [Electrophorus voltai]
MGYGRRWTVHFCANVTVHDPPCLGCRGQNLTSEAPDNAMPENFSTAQTVTANFSTATDSVMSHSTTSVTPQNETTFSSQHVTMTPYNQTTTNNKSSDTGDLSKRNTVFISLLLTGLALIAGLLGWYTWKHHRRTNSKDVKLADESCVPDEENQGYTLVSVAPLKPLETQEKPSQNGESTEAVKTQTPPAATNGHSSGKTADTEL